MVPIPLWYMTVSQIQDELRKHGWPYCRRTTHRRLRALHLPRVAMGGVLLFRSDVVPMLLRDEGLI